MTDNTQYLIKERELSAKGIISRNLIKANLLENNTRGLRFKLNGQYVQATIANLYSTQRNTVLEENSQCVCLTEHFLAAAALLGVDNIDLELTEAELPFGDGSAKLWIDFFEQLGLARPIIAAKYKLKQEYLIADELDPSRYIKLSPSENFQLSYSLDWDHPKINQQIFSWQLGDDISALASARTFSHEEENQMLGLSGWVIGLTEDDFTTELHFPDEPARHKALDLVGDLMLSGINPLEVAMKVDSHKAGHQLNSRAAKLLNELYAQN